MRSATLSLLVVSTVHGLMLPTTPTKSPLAARTSAPRMDIDMNTIVGVGTALLGVGGGVGLIAFTENAGKRNDDVQNEQPCVKCEGRKVITCTICKGTGVDEFANLVAGVQEMTGEQGSGSKVMLDDWEGGPKAVVMYKEILDNYPVKATVNICQSCDGRGVVVCDNCQGTGTQPRFLERYSADDFMD